MFMDLGSRIAVLQQVYIKSHSELNGILVVIDNNHDKNIYIVEIGQFYKSGFFPL